MSDVEPRSDRFETVLVVVLYLVPLTATVLFLAYKGLGGLALALLAVEAAVTASVVVAKRPTGASMRPGPVVLLLALVGVAAAVAAALVLT